MSLKLIDHYYARAEDSRKAAAAATLDNVRERLLESENVWNELARRAVRVEAQREQLMADKQAERAATAAAEPAPELEDELEDESAAC